MHELDNRPGVRHSYASPLDARDFDEPKASPPPCRQRLGIPRTARDRRSYALPFNDETRMTPLDTRYSASKTIVHDTKTYRNHSPEGYNEKVRNTGSRTNTEQNTKFSHDDYYAEGMKGVKHHNSGTKEPQHYAPELKGYRSTKTVQSRNKQTKSRDAPISGQHLTDAEFYRATPSHTNRFSTIPKKTHHYDRHADGTVINVTGPKITHFSTNNQGSTLTNKPSSSAFMDPQRRNPEHVKAKTTDAPKLEFIQEQIIEDEDMGIESHGHQKPIQNENMHEYDLLMPDVGVRTYRKTGPKTKCIEDSGNSYKLENLKDERPLLDLQEKKLTRLGKPTIAPKPRNVNRPNRINVTGLAEVSPGTRPSNKDGEGGFLRKFNDRVVSGIVPLPSTHNALIDEIRAKTELSEGRESAILPRKFKAAPKLAPAMLRKGQPMELVDAAIDRNRHVVIDGMSVALEHGNNLCYSCKGLQLCYEYFKSKKHPFVKIVLPEIKNKLTGFGGRLLKDPYILEDMGDIIIYSHNSDKTSAISSVVAFHRTNQPQKPEERRYIITNAKCAELAEIIINFRFNGDKFEEVKSVYR